MHEAQESVTPFFRNVPLVHVVHCEFDESVQVSGERQPAMGVQASHARPPARRKWPGCSQEVHSESVAVEQVRALVQNGTEEQGLHTEAEPVLSRKNPKSHWVHCELEELLQTRLVWQ